MGKAYGAVGSIPVDLIGQPMIAPAPPPQPFIRVKGATTMAKAKANGVYTDAKGHRFRIKAGDDVPAGATLDGDDDAPKKKADAEPAEKRDKGGAPENRAKAEKPEKA